MMSVKIYDWPKLITSRQLFHAGGMAVEGGYTSGGARVLYPEPGGVSWLEMAFGAQPNAPAKSIVSWVCSKIANGNVFRVRMERSPQVVPYAALGLAANSKGINWDNNQPWDNGFGWFFDPLVTASASALPGAQVLTVDIGTYAPGLSHGHVIGHKDVIYLVDDIEYAGTTAKITVAPPLRKAVALNDVVSLHPSGLFSAVDPESFRGSYRSFDLIELGSVRFGEVRL